MIRLFYNENVKTSVLKEKKKTKSITVGYVLRWSLVYLQQLEVKQNYTYSFVIQPQNPKCIVYR